MSASYTFRKCPHCDSHNVYLSEGQDNQINPFDCIVALRDKTKSLKNGIVALVKILQETNNKVKELEKQSAVAFNEIRKQIQQ